MRTYQFALITGATSGIGRAFAEHLPATTHLALTGRNAHALDEMAKQMRTDGRQIYTLVADLTTEEGRQKVIGWAQSLPIDFFVNNAGTGFYGRFDRITAHDDLQTVHLNVVATTQLSRALLPDMLQRAHAAKTRCGMVLVSSVVGFMPMPWFATYAASKAYNLHYTEALAHELRHEPVDILALCPGATQTNFSQRAKLSPKAMRSAMTPEAVVRGALANLGRRTVYVAGLQNRLVSWVPRLMPRALARWVAGVVMAKMSRLD